MIRILIAEDSNVVGLLLKTIFEQESDMEVVGQAMNGLDAVRMALELKPDIVTMDIRMPVMDGFEATREIMTHIPLPIVVISTSINDAELQTSFRAIEEGALAVIEKPVGFSHPDFEANRRELVRVVRAMSGIKVVTRARAEPAPADAWQPPELVLGDYPEVIAIGSSTGGPQALLSVLKGLSRNFPVPIVITQHMSKGFVGGLVTWLQAHIALKICLAENFMKLTPGTVYLAPDDCHMQVERRMGGLVIRLDDGPPVHGARPSVTQLFRSVAKVTHGQGIGVLMTGMGEDGADGLLAMKRAGCHTVVQDNASAVVYGMPGAALALDAVVEVVRLGRLPVYLTGMVQK